MATDYVRRLIITGPEASETVELVKGAAVIGRQLGVDIRLNHKMISRRHAQIDVQPTICQITDLGSANGTSVNGQPLSANTPLILEPGAKIQIGPFELVFEQIAVEAPPKPKPKPAKPERPPVKFASRQPPPPPKPPATGEPEFDFSQPPPGLSKTDSRYLQYLPGIYQTDFMARFLAIFESVAAPIEWNVENFDLYLDPDTAPAGFLPWLANWFAIAFDPTWSEEQRRILLAEAHDIYGRRGTKRALARVLEIYTGVEPDILDLEADQDPFTFTVKLPLDEDAFDRRLLERIVDANKPAHTSYQLLFKKKASRKKK